MSLKSLARSGLLLYSLGIFFFAVNDALGKWLVADFSVGQVMALRAVGASIVLAPLLWIRRTSLAPRGQWALHAARIVCSALDTYSFYYATKRLPLADVMTFYLAAPLIIAALAALLLRERVDAYRWGAVAIGFVGVLIALNPSNAAFSSSALVALAGATMFALSIVITRQLRDTHWLTLVAYQIVGSGLAGGVTATVGWVAPSVADLGLMFLVGIVSMACFMCITKALALVSASLLAPFQYMSIVWATIMGWLVWRDVPAPNVVLGCVVIVGSGLFLVARRQTEPGA